jgi:AraC-like DNA-binding protein
MHDSVAFVATQAEQAPSVLHRAHPDLHAVVAAPYAGFEPETAPTRGFVVPASTVVPLIVKVEDSPLRPASFVAAPHDGPLVIAGACAPSYLSMWLAPLAAYSVLGVPLTALSGGTADLEDVLGEDARQLAGKIRDRSGWTNRFAAVDCFLRQRLARDVRPDPEIRLAWDLIVQSGGTVRIRRIADETGWSHRHLVTRFKQQVGLTPKAAARITRLDRARRRISPDPAFRWDRVAAETGFADQAHLVREFRRLTGATPTEVRAGQFRSRRAPRSSVP